MRHRHTGGLASAVLFSQWLQRPELGQAESRSLELLPGLPHDCTDPRTWAITYSLPRCIDRELQEVEQLELQLFSVLVSAELFPGRW